MKPGTFNLAKKSPLTEYCETHKKSPSRQSDKARVRAFLPLVHQASYERCPCFPSRWLWDVLGCCCSAHRLTT